MKNSCDLNHTKKKCHWKRSMMFLYDLEEIAGIAGYPKANCGAHAEAFDLLRECHYMNPLYACIPCFALEVRKSSLHAGVFRWSHWKNCNETLRQMWPKAITRVGQRSMKWRCCR